MTKDRDDSIAREIAEAASRASQGRLDAQRQGDIDEREALAAERKIGASARVFLDHIGVDDALQAIRTSLFGGKGSIDFYNGTSRVKSEGSASYAFMSGMGDSPGRSTSRSPEYVSLYASGYRYFDLENYYFIGFVGGSGYSLGQYSDPRIVSHFAFAREDPSFYNPSGYARFERGVRSSGVVLRYPASVRSLAQIDDVVGFISPSNAGLVAQAQEVVRRHLLPLASKPR